MVPVIGILAAIAIPSYHDYQKRAAAQQSQQHMANDPLGLYQNNNGAAPLQSQQPAAPRDLLAPQSQPSASGGAFDDLIPKGAASPQSPQPATKEISYGDAVKGATAQPATKPFQPNPFLTSMGVKPEDQQGAPVSYEQSRKKAHFAMIRAAYPDFDKIVESGAIQDWVKKQPSSVRVPATAILEHGNAQEVIQLFQAFKVSTQGGASPQSQPQPSTPKDFPPKPGRVINNFVGVGTTPVPWEERPENCQNYLNSLARNAKDKMEIDARERDAMIRNGEPERAAMSLANSNAEIARQRAAGVAQKTAEAQRRCTSAQQNAKQFP